MALISRNAKTLIHGLSDFWLRFFRDIKDLEALYEGTQILVGQAYLDLLNDVLNVSVSEAPLFRKEYYRLITVREDQVAFRDGRYVAPLDDYFHAIPQLHNKVFSPTAALEDGVDYTVNGREITFNTDPTNPAPNGYANRGVEVATGGFYRADVGLDWTALAQKGDELVTGGGEVYKIIHVTRERVALARETPAPVPPAATTGFAASIRRAGVSTPIPGEGYFAQPGVIRVTETAFWAIDAAVDSPSLYQNFGHFFTEKRVASESYRALIRGLMQLYVLGPAIDRIESALNVIAGLPVVRDDGEVLQGYVDGVDKSGAGARLSGSGRLRTSDHVFTAGDVGAFIVIDATDHAANLGTYRISVVENERTVLLQPGENAFVPDANIVWRLSRTNVQTVMTSRDIYEFPLSTPVLASVKEPTNWGKLTFRAFEPMTSAARVTDYVKDPEWWHNIVIPEELLPGRSAPDRAVTPQLYPNKIGPAGAAKIGDPGFYIGADENKQLAVRAYRHHANFILLDRFLKFHLFAVTIHPSVNLSGVLATEIHALIKEVKPPQTMLYFQPVTTFADAVGAAETLNAVAKNKRRDVFHVVDNRLRIGGDWVIGMAFRYANPEGWALDFGTGSDYTAVCIGGADPTVQPPDGGGYIIDRALYVRAYEPSL